jgi:hypothetical protein
MFAEPTPGRRFPAAAVAIAAVAVAILVTVLVLLGKRHEAGPPPKTVLPAAAYAPNLVLSNLQMSESTSMSGGKLTYIEGHIANRGPATVTGITVQVVFADRDRAAQPDLHARALRGHASGQRVAARPRRGGRFPPHL